jgi:hypothetical protein
MAYECFLHSLKVDRCGLLTALSRWNQVRPHCKRNYWQFLEEFQAPGIFAMTRKLNFPQLYLFSSNDSIAPQHFVEMVIGEQLAKLGENERDRVIRYRDFMKSPYVQHFDMLPLEYEKELKAFFQSLT